MKIKKLTVALLLIGTAGAMKASQKDLYQGKLVDVEINNDKKWVGKIYVCATVNKQRTEEDEVVIFGMGRHKDLSLSPDATNTIYVYTADEGPKRTDRDVYTIDLGGKKWNNPTHRIKIKKDKIVYIVRGESMEREETVSKKGTMKSKEASETMMEKREIFPLQQALISGKWEDVSQASQPVVTEMTKESTSSFEEEYQDID